ncbi:hypothetical protein ADIS_3493 [Lunatimonas lonarensis]|uniref:Uncharacterized protein n=1 Tax=Lunatimonas lonarensis TaxID=1232681 RepID=R7ZPJ3_9BACT|nr:hypothetical protein ADIS_3493 [Lunatimonas lonarensis]
MNKTNLVNIVQYINQLFTGSGRINKGIFRLTSFRSQI